MIPLAKLAKLAPRHRMRKAALVLGELERELLRAAAAMESWKAREDGNDPGPDAAPLAGARAADLARYAEGVARVVAAEPGAPAEVAGAASALAAVAAVAPARPAVAGGGSAIIRAVDALRHALLASTGQAPADWDLIDPGTGKPAPALRRVRPGVRAYLEDLRSPFNVGAIFRTADAFGVEELVLSPSAADPRHPRSERSAMGAIDLVPWRRAGLECLDPVAGLGAGPGSGHAFALELGGTPIGEFEFPERGMAVIGSEELGVSPEALARCDLGSVSIPMAGAKGSLNAAVAFGILMFAWDAALRSRQFPFDCSGIFDYTRRH